jgi:uncharacterized protein (TIGR01777 family)
MKVNTLSRKYEPQTGVRSFVWDVASGTLDPEALAGVRHIVHLAGAGVADKRWTDQRRREIINSRTESAKLLYNSCMAAGIIPASFVSASGINYYGTTTSAHIYKEDDLAGTDFLAQVCVEWEAAADRFADLGTRVVKLRTGVVLSPDGGALPTMARPVRLGIGAAIGTGLQWMPWLHIDDAVRAYQHALADPNVKGAYNLCAPEHINNTQFTRQLALSMHRLLLLPKVPAAALQMAMGQMAEMVLEGSRADGSKFSVTGFSYKYTTVRQALDSIYNE